MFVRSPPWLRYLWSLGLKTHILAWGFSSQVCYMALTKISSSLSAIIFFVIRLDIYSEKHSNSQSAPESVLLTLTGQFLLPIQIIFYMLSCFYLFWLFLESQTLTKLFAFY